MQRTNCKVAFWFGAIPRKGACTGISQSFAGSVDIVAWPVQRQFTFCTRGKFQKLFSDQGKVISNLGYYIRLAFPATKTHIAYISYKILRYTFDTFVEKIDGRVLVLSPHVKVCDFLGFVELFFPETLHDSLPVDEENYFV